MANVEHVRIMKQGVQAWNRWRQKNPDTRPDLSGVHLLGGDLRGADLRGVDLRGANLLSSDLCGANLTGADLRGTVLYDATLYGAVLAGAKYDDETGWPTELRQPPPEAKRVTQ